MTSLIYFYSLSCIIAILFLIINFIFAPHNPYQEKYSVFECGFHSFLGQNRMQFNIKFFIYALVYLILDLEILLIFPFGLSGYMNHIYGLIVLIIFIVIVSIGFIFELGKGALKIDSKQNINEENKLTQFIFTFLKKGKNHYYKSKGLIIQSNIFFSNKILLERIFIILSFLFSFFILIPIFLNIFDLLINMLYLLINIMNENFFYYANYDLSSMNENILESLEESLKKIKTFFMDAGEGPSNRKPIQEGRVITDSDYESASPTQEDNYCEGESENQESLTSKIINSNLSEFKEIIKTLSNEEIAETMGVIDEMSEEYKASKVPSAEEQLKLLEEKQNCLAEQLTDNLTKQEGMIEGKLDKGKGKEIDIDLEEEKVKKDKNKIEDMEEKINKGKRKADEMEE